MRAPRDVVLVPIGKLCPNKRNVRTHSPSQVRQLVNSISQFGWTYPILTDERWSILAGHGRYLAAQQLGCKEVPVIVIAGLREPEKRALALADNKIATNAGWDRELLAAEIGDLAKLLPEISLDVEITGFESAEVNDLIGEIAELGSGSARNRHSAKNSPSPAAETNAISTSGDLWELSSDKILCGYALSAADLRRLVGSRSGAMVILDATAREAQSGAHRNPEKLAQNSGEAEFRPFIRAAVAQSAEWSADGAIEFVLADWPYVGEPFAAGFLLTPHLADVAICRWQAFTGRDAVLAMTGQPFDDVAATRGTGRRA